MNARFAIPMILATCVWLAATPTRAENPSPDWWDGLEAGPYPVGHRSLYLFDDTRSYSVEGGAAGDYQGRPLRIYLWYPGLEQTRASMRLGDYLQGQLRDPRFAEYENALRVRDAQTASRQTSPAASGEVLQQLLQAPTLAYRDLIPASDRFPLLLYSLGRNDYQLESTVLWEYLASHGYVVATVPQLGRTPAERLGFDQESLEIQARDLEFALARFLRESYVDDGSTYLGGHSSGSVVALLIAARNGNIDGIVSLDGSFNTSEGIELLNAMEIPVEAIRVPILNLYAAGGRSLDLDFSHSLSGERTFHVPFGSGEAPMMATHFDFQNWPLYSLVLDVADPRGTPFRAPAFGRQVYVAACRLTRRFLDALEAEELGRFAVDSSELPRARLEVVVEDPQGARR